MEKYIFDEDLRKLHGNKGREKVKEYTWDSVCSILIKRLKEVSENDD